MIHKYKLKGVYIVLDVYSGSVHVVDDVVFDLLDFEIEMIKSRDAAIYRVLEKDYQTTDIVSAIDEVTELINNGKLYAKNDYEQFKDMTAPAPLKAMCLNIAHDCNLCCDYCFAAKGDFGKGKKLMPLDTAKKAIDFLVENSGKRKNLEVDFFGGEPLMNFDVVKKTVEYAETQAEKHSKKFRFTLTTNGLLLNDEIIRYLNEKISNVVLSIDGRRETNDRFRKTASGQGSYDIIYPQFQKLVISREWQNYYVRGTFTKYNKDFWRDFKQLWVDGFNEISIEPCVCDESLDYAITEPDLPEIFDSYEKIADLIIKEKKNGGKINFFHFMINLDGGPCAIKRLRGCSCGNEYVAVTPEGDIYPCHQFVGMDEYKMGNITDETDEKINPEMKKEFSKTNIFNKDECDTCWAKFYCSGGCNANNLVYAGNMLTPHKISCEMEKKRIECAIMIKAVLA